MWKMEEKEFVTIMPIKMRLRSPKLDTDPIVFSKDRNMDFALGTFIRMLYSCLVDADFLDTESFMKNGDTRKKFGRIHGNLAKQIGKTHL